ncbi:MAG: glutamate--cysteine ligase, partial [Phycicoccus sp.]
HEGLRLWGVSDAVRERYLGVIEGRCTTGLNGAEWMTRAVASYEAAGADRREALRRMVATYAAHMDGGAPVHTWPLP